jgi:hypothetical protein
MDLEGHRYGRNTRAVGFLFASYARALSRPQVLHSGDHGFSVSYLVRGSQLMCVKLALYPTSWRAKHETRNNADNDNRPVDRKL